jgi:Polyketide cyclase / dehydrase and lipid transport
MKRVRGEAQGATTARVDECVALVSRLESYPEWHPEVVRDVAIVRRDGDGVATQANATLRLAIGPLSHDSELLVAVVAAAQDRVVLRRLPYDADDNEQLQISWRFESRGERTRIELDIDALLDVPRFVPVPAAGDKLALGFIAALCAAVGD